jgi:hypothetical protein
MKKLILCAILASTFAIPALAEDTQSDINSDKTAIQKDDAAIANDNAALAKDRAKAAIDNANGSYGKAAEDNMAIGADKSEIEGNKVDKATDEKLLQHHENESEKSTDQ